MPFICIKCAGWGKAIEVVNIYKKYPIGVFNVISNFKLSNALIPME
jgi:hypothetical protein